MLKEKRSYNWQIINTKIKEPMKRETKERQFIRKRSMKKKKNER